jgi:branched-chain amino acid transport system permease protein
MGYIILQLMRLFETFIIAAGLHLAISVGGISFFGFTVVYLAAGYVFAITAQAGLAFWIAVVCALVTSFALGIFFVFLYRRLSDDSFAVFGVASILAFDALLRSWSSVTGGVLGIPGVPRPGGFESSTNLLLLEITIATLVLVAEYVLLKTPYGHTLIAHKENATVLASTAVSPLGIGSIVLLIAAMSAGISGLLGAWRIQYLDPTFGDIHTFIALVTICIVALKPKISWIIGGTTLVVLLPELLRFFPFPSSIFGYLRVLTYGVTLIILVRHISAKYTTNKRTV